MLYIDLKEGALPVNVRIIGSGQVTAALGDQFKKQIVIAGILALLAVGGMIYWRYRVRRIVLPLMATSTSEVIMILAVLSALGQQLDLAAIAGLITVIGTGVDQLVIITDRLMRGATALASKERREICCQRRTTAREKDHGNPGNNHRISSNNCSCYAASPVHGFRRSHRLCRDCHNRRHCWCRNCQAGLREHCRLHPWAKMRNLRRKRLEDEANGASSKKSTRKESAKEGTGNETAEEKEGNGKKAVKTRRKKGSRKDAEENSEE